MRLTRLLLSLSILSLLAWPRNWTGVDLYSDDWHFLAQADLLGMMLGGSYASRPMQFIIFPATYWLVEQAPRIIPVALYLLGILEATLFALWLRPMIGGWAWVAGAAVLICPARAVVHYWASNASQMISHCAALGALLAIRGNRPWAARLLHLAGGLTYESALLVPAVFGSWRICGPTLALVLAWQWFGVRLIGQPNTKSVSPSVGHALVVYGRGAFDLVTAPVRGVR